MRVYNLSLEHPQRSRPLRVGSLEATNGVLLRDDGIHERKITAEDLYRLKLWRETEPEAPE